VKDFPNWAYKFGNCVTSERRGFLVIVWRNILVLLKVDGPCHRNMMKTHELTMLEVHEFNLQWKLGISQNMLEMV
jgi:hypothetical protein